MKIIKGLSINIHLLIIFTIGDLLVMQMTSILENVSSFASKINDYVQPAAEWLGRSIVVLKGKAYDLAVELKPYLAQMTAFAVKLAGQMKDLSVKLAGQTKDLSVKLAGQAKDLSVKLAGQAKELSVKHGSELKDLFMNRVVPFLKEQPVVSGVAALVLASLALRMVSSKD